MQSDFIAKRIIEGILFLSPNPLTIKDIAKATGFKPSLVSLCLKELVEDYETRGVNVKAIAGAYQMVTPADIAPYIEKFATYTKGISLSKAAMETLAIIAYRQPITRAEIEEIRGVNVDGVLNKLLDLKVVRIMGRSEKPGRPVIFGTSREFLKSFGMESLNDLPKPEGGSRTDRENKGNREIYAVTGKEKEEESQETEEIEAVTEAGDKEMVAETEEIELMMKTEEIEAVTVTEDDAPPDTMNT